jgi:superfamily II DNA/RNA helicase
MDAQPTFADLGLPTPVVDELTRQGITAPFPIQLATISDALAGRNTLGRGRTGSGKTLAFSLPMIARLAADNRMPRKFRPRALILVPTRELANQVRDVINPLARTLDMSTAVVYGGVGYGKQIEAMRNGTDIVVACPGRFVDLLESGHVQLDDIEIVILDEADHMAELGFLEHVTQILGEIPREAQHMLFSATLDRGIDKVVRKFLNDPVTHEIETPEDEEVTMTHHFFHVSQDERFKVIADLCAAPGKSLVFTRTKHGARKLALALVKAGVPSVELHGDLSQMVRARNLAAFANGKADTLVATDIAARGIHVDDIAIVIHADPPEEHKAFLHRSGRTARAGAEGTVITMVTENQRKHVKRLAKDAGIEPTNTKVAVGHELLTFIAPGERTFKEMPSIEEPRKERPARSGGPRHRNAGGHRGRRDDRRDNRRDDDRRDERPRSFDRDDRPRRDDRRDERPRSFDRDDRPRRDDDRPRTFNRDERPRRDDRRDERPRSFDRDDRPRRDDDRPRGSRPGSPAGTRGRYGNDNRDGRGNGRASDGRGGARPPAKRGGPGARGKGKPARSYK